MPYLVRQIRTFHLISSIDLLELRIGRLRREDGLVQAGLRRYQRVAVTPEWTRANGVDQYLYLHCDVGETVPSITVTP